MSVYSFPRNFRTKLFENIVNGISDVLLEEFHISRTFDNVVDDIYNNFIKNKGRLYGCVYSGWKLDIDKQECKKCELKNNTNFYSIYVNWFRDISNTELKGCSDIRGIDFSLDKHIIKININLVNGVNKDTLKGLLQHEFIHIKHMYRYKNKNILLNYKDMSDNIENIFQISEDMFNKVKDILYMMSPTEVQARINQQYRLIKDMSFDDINNIKKDKNVILSLVEYFHDINLYDKYILDFKYLKDIVNGEELQYILFLNIIGYYAHLEKLLKNDIKYSSINNIINNKSYTNIDKQNARNVKYDIDKFITKYLDKLKKTTAYALKQNGWDKYDFDRMLNEMFS